MPLLFALLALESFGLPVSGETALIACSVLAYQGSLSIVWAIVVAASAAVIGDNLGYWAARKGGRPLLQRHRLRAATPIATCRGESGSSPSTVARPSSSAASWPFYGSGILWATLIGLVSYYLGDAAAHALNRYGLCAPAELYSSQPPGS